MPPLYPPFFCVVPALSFSLPSQASSWKSRPPLADFTSSSPHPQQSGSQPPLHSPCSCQGHGDLCIYRSNGSSTCFTLFDLPNAFGSRRLFPTSNCLFCSVDLETLQNQCQNLNFLSFSPNQTILFHFLFC